MESYLKRVVRGFARRTGLLPYPVIPPQPEIGRPDIDPEAAGILARAQPFTLTNSERLLAVVDAVRYLTKYQIPGAVIECGVWRGGSSMAAALALKAVGDISRDIYLYDTFEGMSLPTEVDKSFDGKLATNQLERDPFGTGVWCHAGIDDVKANLASTGYPAARLHYVQGRVEDTITDSAPDQIALLRLDTDWYESTRHELEHLYPRLVRGGILIIDDYGHWQGARKATDEYFARHPNPVFLHRADYTCRVIVKP